MAKVSPWFVVIATIFVTCLITANIIAVKLVGVFGLVFPAAVVIFPLSYVIGDVLTEVYGYAQARRVIWLGFGCNLIAVAAIWLGQEMPAAGFWDAQPAYERILGYTPRLLAASFLAYFVGEFANSLVLARMKVATRGRWLWSRTIGSTIVGEGLDEVVFTTLAYAGTGAPLLTMILTKWVMKVVYETLATPFTYAVVGFLKRREGVDVYDYATDFNPLTL